VTIFNQHLFNLVILAFCLKESRLTCKNLSPSSEMLKNSLLDGVIRTDKKNPIKEQGVYQIQKCGF